jgi:hypothetical protein
VTREQEGLDQERGVQQEQRWSIGEARRPINRPGRQARWWHLDGGAEVENRPHMRVDRARGSRHRVARADLLVAIAMVIHRVVRIDGSEGGQVADVSEQQQPDQHSEKPGPARTPIHARLHHRQNTGRGRAVSSRA